MTADEPQAVKAARQFLHVAWEGPTPSDAMLTAALDRLVVAYHDTQNPQTPEWASDAPRGEPMPYQQVGQRFPDYGFYPHVDPLKVFDPEVTMGDAIDDLIDITSEMTEVVWLADNVGVREACWTFHANFFHWGTHARGLLVYLHSRWMAPP